MSIWDRYKRSANGSVVLAAIALGRDLMEDDPANFKRGYTADNAFLAVRDAADAAGDVFTDEEEATIKGGLRSREIASQGLSS
jgi:hypothetical protein